MGVNPELIDTLWNVNVFSPGSLSGQPTELIDTLWNVNYHADGEPCKFFSN